MKRLSAAQRLALARLQPGWVEPAPVRVTKGRSACAPSIKRMPLAECRVALRAKDGQSTKGGAR